MKKYTHLFFDLDNTLWDFNANSFDALHIALKKLGLNDQIEDYQRFYSIYHPINESLWALYRDNKINKSELRVRRFEETLEAYGTPMPGFGGAINDAYLNEMPSQLKLVDGAQQVLDYLHGKYRMAIITNGFREVQIDKIEQSGMSKFFEKIFISEEIGAQKPNKLIFEHALKSMNAPKKSTLMIGDSWEADIVGAMKMNIDQIYYKPSFIAIKPDSNIIEILPGTSVIPYEPEVERYLGKKCTTRLIIHLTQLLDIL